MRGCATRSWFDETRPSFSTSLRCKSML